MDSQTIYELHGACQKGDISIIRASEFFSDHVNIPVSGLTLIQRACENRQWEIAEKIARIGCDLNVKDASGATPLLRACINEGWDFVKTIISLGVSVNN